MAKPTNAELTDLYYKVENEGFGYYMLDYGPDLNLIARMGFDAVALKDAINLLSKVQMAIMNIEPENE